VVDRAISEYRNEQRGRKCYASPSIPAHTYPHCSSIAEQSAAHGSRRVNQAEIFKIEHRTSSYFPDREMANLAIRGTK